MEEYASMGLVSHAKFGPDQQEVPQISKFGQNRGISAAFCPTGATV